MFNQSLSSKPTVEKESMARPKMKALTRREKEKEKEVMDDLDPPARKKQKKDGKHSAEASHDIDEGEVNVDEMLDKILKERAKINKVTGELIFMKKEFVAIGANNLEYLSYCYPLGLSMIVQVPVSRILPPPLSGCRPFNESHMWEILKELQTKTAMIPQVADLLPVSITKSVAEDGSEIVTERKLRLSTQAKLREVFDDSEVFFYAVSGQHSAYAWNFLQRLPKISKAVKENNKMRWSRMLDGKAKIVDLCNISHVGNEQNVLFRFESSFIELMVQARNQWVHSGSPEPSKQCSKPRKNYEGFVEIASLTLQKGSLREIKEILLAPKKAWTRFLKVAEGWIECRLPQPMGNLPELSLEGVEEEDRRDVTIMEQLEKNRRKMKVN
ncbi:hypothetical protein R1sor_004950 [Riccia sorocarpa]|uniref:Uncharacterized protein n=1 Tax=Riccia sorocarpa TaxID=122646 RepID=A0ABD3HM06_9MARC